MTSIAEKWGERVAARGFAQIPNHLLLLNQFLGPDEALSPIELLVLIQLAGAWWKRDELPFPSVATLALRCGASQRQIQRALAKLEERELVKRVSRRKRGVIASNAYDLTLLTEALEQVAKEFPNQYPRRLQPISSATGTAAGKGTATGAATAIREVTLENDEPASPSLSPETRKRIKRTLARNLALKKEKGS